MGGTDLYMAVRKNGQWGEMINLGDEINTSADEMFPFLHQGKRLFFASSGKTGSKGGLDIYYAMKSGNEFKEPQNFSELNSDKDDFGFVMHPEDEVGYFTSQKDGGLGDDDIYKVVFEGQYDLELLVRDKKSLDPLPNVKVVFNDNTTLSTSSMGLLARKLEKETDYTATTEIEDYMNESKSFTTKGQPYGTVKVVLNVEKVEVGQKFVLENIYYDFDKWDILPNRKLNWINS